MNTGTVDRVVVVCNFLVMCAALCVMAFMSGCSSADRAQQTAPEPTAAMAPESTAPVEPGAAAPSMASDEAWSQFDNQPAAEPEADYPGASEFGSAYDGEYVSSDASAWEAPGGPTPMNAPSILDSHQVGDADAVEGTFDENSSDSGPLGLSGTAQGVSGWGSGQSIGYGGTTARTDASTSDDEANQADILAPDGIGSGGGGPGPGSNGLGHFRGLGYGGSSPPPAAAPTVAAREPEADTDDILADIDRKLARLPLANIAFNTPETISLGESETIELLLSLQEAEDSLREAVRGLGPVETARVQITDQMEARLTGTGFRIESITPDRQAVSRSQRTVWQWQIEPTKAATLELHLALSAVIKVDGTHTTRSMQTFEKTIIVEVPAGQRITALISDNLQWLVTALLIPVAGGAYQHYRKKKRQLAGGDDSTPARKAA